MTELPPHEFRFCARCNQETLWTNLPDYGLYFRCTTGEKVTPMEDGPDRVDVVAGCGLSSLDELTPLQEQRQRDYVKRTFPVRQSLAYDFV